MNPEGEVVQGDPVVATVEASCEARKPFRLSLFRFTLAVSFYSRANRDRHRLCLQASFGLLCLLASPDSYS
jgi:hypothetical protein